MDRSSYGATAEMIGRITDPAQLTAMMRNPQYAGFTNVIVARLQEINHMRQAAQGAAPQPPTVAQQALQNAQQAQQPLQAMAKGGIVAFKDGGRVKRFAKGGDTGGKDDPYAEGWKQVGQAFKKPAAAALDIAHLPGVAARRLYNVGVGLPNALGADLPYVDPGSITPYYDQYVRGAQAAPADQSYGVDAMSGAAPTVQPPGAQPAPSAPAPEPLPPLTAKDMGYSPMGGISSLLASSGGSRPDRRLSDYTDEMAQVLGPNKDLADARANLAAQKANAINNALMYGGLGMARAAGEHPQSGILGSLATGATEGLTSFDKQEQERQQMLRDLGRQERAERMGILSAGVNERGQDVRADRQMQLQRMGLGLQAQALKAPYLQEQAIQRRALALANQARAKGSYSGDPTDYEMQARQEFAGTSPTMLAAQLRANAAQNTGTVAGWNKYQQMNGPISFQAYQQMVGGGATGPNYGTLE